METKRGHPLLPVLSVALMLLGCHDKSDDPAPAIGLSSSSLAYSCTEGGANPPNQVVTLTNGGEAGSLLNWSASSNQPWLSVSPASGSLDTTGSTMLTISVDATAQPEAWTGSTSTTNAPAADAGMGAVWTGSAMLVWSGDPATPGKFYDPATDTWFGSTSTVGAPSTRTLFSAVWTGTEMIVWGGEENGTLVNTGGLYSPPIPAEGPNTGTITITAGGASDSPRTITIDLTVDP